MRRRQTEWIAAISLALAVCTPSRRADAYRVYTTYSQGASPPADCTLAQPRKLHWEQPSVPYWIGPPPAGLDRNAVELAIHLSFDTWHQVPDCNQPSFAYQGEAKLPAGFTGSANDYNENGVLWVTKASRWRHGPGVLALTTLTFSTCTGRIVDADIELNAAEFTFSASPLPPPNTVDLQNTVTHEVGHLLGLDHSGVPGSTMFFNAPDAETTKRTLTDDDIAGLCCLYRPDAPMVVPNNTCEGVDRASGAAATPDAGTPTGGGGGCQSATPGVAPGVSGALLALAAIAAWRRRREGKAAARPAGS